MTPQCRCVRRGYEGGSGSVFPQNQLGYATVWTGGDAQHPGMTVVALPYEIPKGRAGIAAVYEPDAAGGCARAAQRCIDGDTRLIAVFAVQVDFDGGFVHENLLVQERKEGGWTVKCLLASMDGMSNAAFRSVCFEYGADGATTEMIGAAGFARAKRRRRPIMDALVLRRCEEGPLAAQIIGSDPGVMAAAAARLEALERFDAIEINMGCPARVVVGSGNGSALLQNPGHAGEILRAVCGSVRLPVRLKLRLGWDEAHITAPEIARMAQEAGCREIILHGRTRSQFYGGDVLMDEMRRVRAAVEIPLYANGAVRCAGDAAGFARSVGADGVCIGRAALKAPWIFDDIRALERGECPPERDAVERVALLMRLAERLCAQKPERFAICEMRKFTPWYLEGFTGAEALFEAVKRTETLDEYRRLHECYLEALLRMGDTQLHSRCVKTPVLDTVRRSV